MIFFALELIGIVGLVFNFPVLTKKAVII